jgi:hypothetical protein
MKPSLSLQTAQPQDITVHALGAMGYGNADSSISRTKQLASGELSQQVDEHSQSIINAASVLVSINNSDDGCIDGRETLDLYVPQNDATVAQPLEDNSNHERAKVAGGGYITSQAMLLGVGQKGESIDIDILSLGERLNAKGIYCGAHTGAHQQGEGTDCGANDKFFLILQNAVRYRQQVGESVKALIETAGLLFNADTFAEVLANWEATLNDANYYEKSTGASRLQQIFAVQKQAGVDKEKPVAVTKHLKGDHNEDYIIVNFVQGMTVSQGILAKMLHEAFSDTADKNLAQTFVVDAWRLVELVKGVAGEDTFEQALYAGVIYQVATAATLTDGSLPIFVYTQAA